MRQMTAGGTVVTFEVAGGKDAAFRVMNAFGLIAVSNNLGDSKSLATHPATTTHMRIGAEERAKLGISDGVIRVSIGLEDPEDLTDDLAQALATIAPVAAMPPCTEPTSHLMLEIVKLLDAAVNCSVPPTPTVT